jgi:hypothetical protein
MARQSAQLITPKGKTIKLSPEVYKQIKHLLTGRTRRPSRSKIAAAIRATYGRYAGPTSLTAALLAEHAAEHAREEAKLKRLRG